MTDPHPPSPKPPPSILEELGVRPPPRLTSRESYQRAVWAGVFSGVVALAGVAATVWAYNNDDSPKGTLGTRSIITLVFAAVSGVAGATTGFQIRRAVGARRAWELVQDKEAEAAEEIMNEMAQRTPSPMGGDDLPPPPAV